MKSARDVIRKHHAACPLTPTDSTSFQRVPKALIHPASLSVAPARKGSSLPLGYIDLASHPSTQDADSSSPTE